MNTKVQKTILGKEIKSFQFYKMNVPRLYRKKIFGHIWLEGKWNIQIAEGKYFIINAEGKKEGVILKTSEAYRKIKRMISRWFSMYRKGEKGGQCHHSGYWKSRAVDGMHNVNLFRHSEVSFKQNKTNFLILAS